MEKFLDEVVVGSWEIDDGSVDVDGDVHITGKMDKLPVVFGHVSGSFYAAYLGLKSITGLPTFVGYGATLRGNRFGDIQELKMSALLIDLCDSGITSITAELAVGVLDISQNRISRMDLSKSIIQHALNCSHNQLRDLGKIHDPENVNCSHNKLQSLRGLPEIIRGDLDCSYNELRDLSGSVKKVVSTLYTEGNPISRFVGIDKCGTVVGSADMPVEEWALKFSVLEPDAFADCVFDLIDA